MRWPGPDRWQRLWQSVGASGNADPWYETLTRAYAEPHRHYHNQRHIADCLAEFDAVRGLAKRAEAVELALWFHDVVYDPKAADNEEQSAAMAKRCLEAAGQPDLGRMVGELVMATKLHGGDAGPDAALVVDVDLSILGQDESRFAEYESQIRAEYEWVPQEIFKTKRGEILRQFLGRKHIYSTEPFINQYERRARHNLEESIRKLALREGSSD